MKKNRSSANLVGQCQCQINPLPFSCVLPPHWRRMRRWLRARRAKSQFTSMRTNLREQRSILRTMPAAPSDSPPTLYVVHGRDKPVLCGPPNSIESNLFHHGETTYRVGWLSEYATVMVLRIDREAAAPTASLLCSGPAAEGLWIWEQASQYGWIFP